MRPCLVVAMSMIPPTNSFHEDDYDNEDTNDFFLRACDLMGDDMLMMQMRNI